MFRMSSTHQFIGEIKTIRIKKKYKESKQLELFPTQKEVINNPFNNPFGTYEDIDGKRWDIQGIQGEYVFARPYRTDYFTDTSMHQYSGIQNACWDPYKVEMVG